MAAYKEEAGAILQPGNQINRLSSYNTEGVYGWPGVEAYELIGYVKIDNLAADKASSRASILSFPLLIVVLMIACAITAPPSWCKPVLLVLLTSTALRLPWLRTFPLAA
jgi:hypothetical protein